MFRVEHEYVVQFQIGQEEPVVVVHGQTVDQRKVRLLAVLDELKFFRFCFREDENGADGLIRCVNIALRIRGHAVGADQLEPNLLRNILDLGVRLRPGQPVHPGHLLFLFGLQARPVDRLAGEYGFELNARNGRRVRPDDFVDIERDSLWLLLLVGRIVLLLGTLLRLGRQTTKAEG